jgi:Domain of unknown function (DUF6378)
MSQSILMQADAIVNGPRQEAYGSPLVNHQRIADLWSVILGKEVQPHEVALCMVATKMARLMQTPDHEDSVLDIAGYAQVYSYIRKEFKETVL